MGGNFRSLAETEEIWRGFNGCGKLDRTWKKRGKDICLTAKQCETPFVSCHLDVGQGWPKTQPPPFLLPGCAYEPPTLPILEYAWACFEEQIVR